MVNASVVKRICVLIAALLMFCAAGPLSAFRGAGVSASPDELTSVECSEADRIIVDRAIRLAFLGSPDMTNTWLPRYSFYACNSTKKYESGVLENSMPYSRSALFNGTEFEGMQQYIGWVDADTGATPDYSYSVNNFLNLANTPNSIFDMAARMATAYGENWGALMGSDCSAFLSYAWQIPHMTTYMFTSDAVDWNICRVVPATNGHESAYTMKDLYALQPGDALICCNKSGEDEHGNPIYRGHCVLITDVKLNPFGDAVEFDTLEEISPRAVAKTRSAEEFLTYCNKLTSSGSYYKFYRLISKSHLKLEIELFYDVCGGKPLDDSESVAFAFVRTADGGCAYYDDYISLVPERDGYVFAGWSLSPGGSVIRPGEVISTMRDHTLFAVWTRTGA